jgi:hypothetical protein
MDSFTQCAIAKFVTKFLSDNGSEELVDKWNDQDNADAFSALVKKACKRSSDKKLKDPNAPKRGRSAYIFFCSKNREKAKERLGEGAKATEVTSELGKMWNELKASTKKADKTALLGFEAEAAEDKSRYDEEKKDYQPPSDEELAKTTAKKGRKTSDKDTNSPKGRKSAYIYFCSAMRAQVKEELGEEGKSLIMTELGKRWKELKEDEQRSEELAEYTKMAEDDKARYQDEKENASDEKTSPKKSPKKSKKQLVEKPVESEESTDDVKGKTTPKKKTGYSYFCSYNRDSVKSENPKMKGQDITRELARLWKELTKDEQKEWSDSAETE